jgi:hypothetical protein
MTTGVHGTSTGRPTDVTTQRGREVERETETERRTTSSLSAAQTRGRAEEASLTTRLRSIDERDALARLVLTIRPDWSPLDVVRAIERDDRPWRSVVAGSIRAAADADVKHPNGMRYLAPLGEPTPVPPSLDEWRSAERCEDHGAIVTQCALCRRGIGETL